MQINISNLSEGEHSYELSEDSRILELDNQFQGSAVAHVTLEKSINQIVATVTASCKGVFVCDRCGREYNDLVTTRFTSVYSWKEEEENDDDDFYILQPDDNIIDISDSVAEYLTLAIPLKLLCNKSDCEIPNYPTAEEGTIDPRWEQLQKLLKTKE